MPKTYYQCSICEAGFDDIKDAENCEAKHQVIDKIVLTSFHYRQNYPSKITVQFKNGDMVEYRKNLD